MHALALALAAVLAAGDDGWDEEAEYGARPRRLSLAAWGGQAFDVGGAREGGPLAGAEVAWTFDAVELGVLGQLVRLRAAPGLEWSPVVLARLTERFRTAPAVETSFTFGFGAGKTDDWVGWYQIAVGLRVGFGETAFLGAELSFEQYDLVRLAIGLGLRI